MADHRVPSILTNAHDWPPRCSTRPASERNLQLILPDADAVAMSKALDDFARRADPVGGKRLVVVLDNAGRHIAKALAVPANVCLHPLPAHTPESAPVESLWPLMRAGIANRTFDALYDLEDKLAARRKNLMNDPTRVRGRCGHAWAAALG